MRAVETSIYEVFIANISARLPANLSPTRFKSSRRRRNRHASCSANNNGASLKADLSRLPNIILIAYRLSIGDT